MNHVVLLDRFRMRPYQKKKRFRMRHEPGRAGTQAAELDSECVRQGGAAQCAQGVSTVGACCTQIERRAACGWRSSDPRRRADQPGRGRSALTTNCVVWVGAPCTLVGRWAPPPLHHGPNPCWTAAQGSRVVKLSELVSFVL